ncbi:hypothetical protein KAR91_58835, partial [Candidatus Pacearchaeota archaeon]|nr:hypothetical protein [Candidatus Pacearchaeota archaeon]
MKTFILTILIVGMWGTVGGNPADSTWDELYPKIRVHGIYIPDRPVIVPCCTVFVDKPCTVWVSAEERLDWEKIER